MGAGTRRGWAAGLLVGVVVGGCSGDRAPDEGAPASTSAATSSAPTADTAPSVAPDPDAELDDCVVGRWETVSLREAVEVEGAVLTAVDARRTLQLDPTGAGTVIYGSDPAELLDAGGEVVGQLTQSGLVSLQATTVDGSLSLAALDGDLQRQVELDGRVVDLAGADGAQVVEYTCTGDEFTQQGEGFTAVFARTG